MRLVPLELLLLIISSDTKFSYQYLLFSNIRRKENLSTAFLVVPASKWLMKVDFNTTLIKYKIFFLTLDLNDDLYPKCYLLLSLMFSISFLLIGIPINLQCNSKPLHIQFAFFLKLKYYEVNLPLSVSNYSLNLFFCCCSVHAGQIRNHPVKQWRAQAVCKQHASEDSLEKSNCLSNVLSLSI